MMMTMMMMMMKIMMILMIMMQLEGSDVDDLVDGSHTVLKVCMMLGVQIGVQMGEGASCLK
jgi:hypothetical protein